MSNSKILAFVIGMTPAIITETLFALATRKDSWIPDEIVVFTTISGANNIQIKLLDSGVYSEFCLELGLNIPFNHDSIKIVAYNGYQLDDIRSIEENTLFADFITFEIFELCKNVGDQLYVSLAGGRKTMGYYIGYALSLFGRHQDKLLHVLVNYPFDMITDFYYPLSVDKSYLFNGEVYSSNLAKIDLAEIPFVRLRYNVPKQLLNGKLAFSRTVTDIQNFLLIIKPNLIISLVDCRVQFNNKIVIFPAFYIALYCYFAKLKQSVDLYCLIKQIKISELFDILSLCLRRGRDSARFIQISTTLNGLDFEATIRTAISKINTKLRKELGFEAEYFVIDSVKDKNYGINQYGIKVNSENITILE